MDIRLFRILLLTISFAAALGAHAQSAEASSAVPRIALRITDLTEEERDAFTRDLHEQGNARIVFACVPAGVLVIEGTESGRSADNLRLHALPGLLRNVAADRITEDQLTLRNAEDLCAEARNR